MQNHTIAKHPRNRRANLHWLCFKELLLCFIPTSCKMSVCILTHWCRAEIFAIVPPTFSYAFSWIKDIWTSIKISPKFVPKRQISNIPALVQIVAWHRPDDKYALLGLNELIMGINKQISVIHTIENIYPDNKVRVANMGPTWVLASKQLDDDKASFVHIFIYIHIEVHILQTDKSTHKWIFHWKINFAKLSNLMPCINKLYLVL